MSTSSELATTVKEINIQQLDTLKKEKAITKKKIAVIDTSYRFPNLTTEEIKKNNKQKAKMLKQLAKFDKKQYAFVPSGTTTINKKHVSIQAFYIQITEVTNLEYRTFLFDLMIQGRKDDFLLAKPDQSRWVKDYQGSYNKPMEEHYFSHAAYNDYPVVAISRIAAEMYCHWLTLETSKAYKKKLKQSINNLRIPTEYEWIHAAFGGEKQSTYPWAGPNLRNSKGEFLANFKPMKDNYKADGAFHTAKVGSYNPNDFGLYDMAGNVAEMIYYENDKELPGTKGGSWTSIGQELQIIDGKDRFKGKINASVDVGFRPVITFMGK